MQTRFILGPAGSGKTFRCLAEIRATLKAAPDGPPLILLAPKQTTYQLERQLLTDPSIPGYTRLHILSFERLALFVLSQLQKPPPRMLDEEGRVMVLRSLLAKKRDELKLFRASARLTGFAQHLSLVLRELQRHQLTPESLAELAEHVNSIESLHSKLHDLAMLLRDYLDWLQARRLEDAEHLLDFATQTLRDTVAEKRGPAPLALGELWMDGFNELSQQELDLLIEVLPHTARANITFCLDRVPAENISWLSNWSLVRHAWQECRKRIAGLPHGEIVTELLPRRADAGRFRDNPVLRHLEAHWAAPAPFAESANDARLKGSIRIAACANPEAETTVAAREILRFVRSGGRYREVTVLARDLRAYHEPLVNSFTRYGIPFFLDRRESVSHHPLAELSRNALRTVAHSWTRDDWFAALKTGLVPIREATIDRLENEALAGGWKGLAKWQETISISENPYLTAELEEARGRIVPIFNKLAVALGNKPTGAKLAAALREFWNTLGVAERLQEWSDGDSGPLPIHLTVWEQMNAWLENLELAFPAEALELREWLPILEAGLAGLTVGVIPPALDQVTIGAIDRSRNPDIRLAIIVGMNETVFPAPPRASVLLTDTDRAEIEKHGISLSTPRQQLSQERFYGYVAFTRARERLVLTYATADSSGSILNPSPFLAHFKELFPALEIENVPQMPDWRESEHASELTVPLLRDQSPDAANKIPGLSRLDDLPALTGLREKLRHLVPVSAGESLSPALALKLYGESLGTSVSRMEQFAACPFKFFVHSGLRAEERKLFELDVRDQGNFQHEALDLFHNQLKQEKKLWRDISPAEARERMKSIARSLMVNFRDGLLQSSEEGKFAANVLVDSLQDFVETLVGWMRNQYAFDPMETELPFGEESFPPWDVDLGEGRHLLLHGRIDRIDLWRETDGDSALCVVVDYKSSQKQLDALLMEHGLQLQLPAYLNVLRHWPNPRPIFKVGKLVPAGVFYVNLRGKYKQGSNRNETLAGAEEARKLAYRHAGRFDVGALDKLDRRKASEGDQFNYRRKKDGGIYGNCAEAMASNEFLRLLDGVEAALKKMGRAIYAGETKVDPFRRGAASACDQCDYRSVCRIDPWTHVYRVLRKTKEEEEQ